MLFILILLISYVLVTGILFNHLFKPIPSDFSSYFHPNQKFVSQVEGLVLEVKKIENDWAYCRSEMQAFAAGPPVHIHEHFDEAFTVEKGTASFLVNGEKITLQAGETIVIPKGVPHKPFNETAEVVIFNDVRNQHPSMTASFAYGLSNIYSAMDKIGNPRSILNLFALAAQGNGFDTWASNAPLVPQKALRWILGPTARLLGYGK
ncbi:cupin domain-containing protein [Haliscomenobacter hydrossis]|uniref:Cupin 2 conserved barrel domain protein n=1 Tax=Haliscomenobacter hydrossis (strain ATCC 27775 / DSM 1100 / LMG 10767 / O) TaxID=760192 RepID=F4KVU9_HALH1|nr:cupin domain-containing protein [Haliscomenobacter hydrossis]AEE53524.1 Cupin 2 conserved barrel domain protein [Haliscomenobacter hydrossis DSM 1100]